MIILCISGVFQQSVSPISNLKLHKLQVKSKLFLIMESYSYFYVFFVKATYMKTHYEKHKTVTVPMK